METKLNAPKGFNSYEEYRNYDNRACEVVNNFLDRNCYNFFTSKTLKRITATSEQIKGVDCKFQANKLTKSDYEYICDEKAAVKWANKDLQTFSIELQFVNRAGHLHNGWFLAENQINNCYNFIYTDKIKDENGNYNYKTFTESDIKEVTCIFVRKERIKEYLKSIGWTQELLEDKCKEIRRTNGKCDLCDIEKDGLRFCFSSYLPERPINILLSRRKLIELSDIVYKYNDTYVEFWHNKKKWYAFTEK